MMAPISSVNARALIRAIRPFSSLREYDSAARPIENATTSPTPAAIEMMAIRASNDHSMNGVDDAPPAATGCLRGQDGFARRTLEGFAQRVVHV